MANLLILINGSKFVTEYIEKDIYASAPARAAGSLTEADLYVNSPNQPCVRMIVNSRQSYCTYGK